MESPAVLVLVHLERSFQAGGRSADEEVVVRQTRDTSPNALSIDRHGPPTRRHIATEGGIM